MAAPPTARPVAVTASASAETRRAANRAESNTAALTSTDQLFATWSAEPTEPVAAAALRSFCEGGGESGDGGSGSGSQSGSGSSSSRRSGGRGRREATIAAAAAASPSPSLTFHPAGLLVAPPHSARSTSGASSTGEGSESSRASSLSPRRSQSRSRSPPSSSSSRGRGRGAEGKRGQSDGAGSGPTAPRPDYSAASSDSHARMAQVETVRREEARVPPRRGPAPAAARYNTFGEWERPGIGKQSAQGAATAAASTSSSPLVQAQLALQQADHIPRWLSLHGFDESVYPRLVQSLCPDDGDGAGSQASSSLSLPLLLRQTKSSLKSLLGIRDGIRLHLALRDLEAAQRLVESAGPAASAAARPGSGRNGGQRPHLSPESVLPAGIGAADCSMGAAVWRRELHPAGVHGYCALSSCDLPASSVCSSKSCGLPLCTFHAHKLLLTGNIVCEDCYGRTGIADSVKEAVGINALQEQGYPVEQCVVQ